MSVNVAIELRKMAAVNHFEYKLFLSWMNVSVAEQSWTKLWPACVFPVNRFVTRPSVNGADQTNHAPHGCTGPRSPV